MAIRNSTPLLLLTAVGLIAVYGLFIRPYYFNDALRIPLEYPAYFARMVSAEFYFSAAGFFNIALFTPSMCAGGFLASSPIDVTYSLPQLLSMLTDPVLSVFLTHWFTAIVAGWSTYLLLRARPFSVEPWFAIAGAALFAYNSFHMFRMLEGHLNFHAFMFTPLLALLLLRASNAQGFVERLWLVGLGAAVASLILHSGAAHLVIPIGLSILMLLVLASFFGSGPNLLSVGLSPTLCAFLTFCLSAAKLSVTYNLLTNFPRDFYDLTGLESLVDGFSLPITSLLGFAHITEIGVLGQHEFEYSVSPLVLPGLLIAIWIGFTQYRRASVTFSALAFMIYLLLVAVNFESAEWQGILAQVPVLNQSFSVFRWYACLMLIVVVVSMLGLSRYRGPSRGPLCALVIVFTPIWQLSQAPEWEALPQINYAPLLQGLSTSRIEGVTPITSIGVDLNSDGTTAGPSMSSDLFFPGGRSQIFCWEPLFGYSAEKLRVDNLRQGDVRQRIGQEFNMKNPACYVYPEANQCQAGDNFRVDQAEALMRFTQYRTWKFEIPTSQRVANRITQVSWLMLLLFFVFYSVNLWGSNLGKRHKAPERL